MFILCPCLQLMPVSIVTIDGQNRIIAIIDKNLMKVFHETDFSGARTVLKLVR